MSDVGLGATLQLDIAEALSRIDALAAQITTATTDVPTSLADPDTTGITSSIDAAVDAADVSVVPEADAGDVTSSIDAAVDAADGTVPVDADTAQAEAQIDSLSTGTEATVTVDADTAAADSEIDATVARAEADEVVLNVTADTGQADTEIAAVGDAAAGATGDVSGLGAATEHLGQSNSTAALEAAGLTSGLKVLSGVQATAAGSATGVADAISGISVGSAATVTGVGAVVVAIDKFFEAGVRVQESKERFSQTFGGLAEDIANVNVGTLNGDLSDLALQLGTSTSKLRDAASGIGQFGAANGTAADEVARTAENVLALSLRARALNPALGESGDIAASLQGALARGGRALSVYGIALTTAEIQERARNDTGKETNAQLTQFDKLAAGAAIAAERLGPSLGETVAQGAEKANIQLDRIRVQFARLAAETGEPLVSPILDLLTNLVPIGLAAGETLGVLVQALIPFIQATAAVAAPVAAAASAIGELDPALVSLVAGLVAAAAGLGAFVTSFTAGIAVANPVLAGFLATVGLVVAATSAYSVLTGQSHKNAFASEVKEATNALKDEKGQLDASAASVAKYIETKSRFESRNQLDDLDRLGISLEHVGELAKNGQAGLEQFVALLKASDESSASAADNASSFVELQKVLQESSRLALGLAVDEGSLTAAQRENVEATNRGKDGVVDYAAALDDAQPALREHAAAIDAATAKYGPQIAASEALASAYNVLGTENRGLLDQFESFAADGLDSTEVVRYAQALDRASLSEAGMGAAASLLGTDVATLQKIVGGLTAAVDGFADSALGGLPKVSDAYKPVEKATKAASGATHDLAKETRDAERAIRDASHGVETANRATVDSLKAVDEATQGVTKATDDLVDAQQSVLRAEQDLARLRQGASARDLEQGELNIDSARISSEQATLRVTDAEEALSKARDEDDPDAVRKAELDLESARIRARESVFDIQDAEADLQSLREKGTDQDAEVVAAQDRVSSAYAAVESAQQAIVDAHQNVADAQQAVADTAYAAALAVEHLTDAQEALSKVGQSSGGGGGGGSSGPVAVSLTEFISNLHKQADEVRDFLADLDAIFAAGGEDIAATLATEGFEAGNAYADQLAASIHGGASALVTSAEAAVDDHNAAISQANTFLREQFGPKYIATTGLVASLAQEAFGANLSFAERTRIATNLAGSTLTEEGKAIALIAATEGRDAAKAYADLFQIDAKTLAAGEAAARTLTDDKGRVVPAASALGKNTLFAFDTVVSQFAGSGTNAVTAAATAIDKAAPGLTGAATRVAGAAHSGFGGLIGDFTTVGQSAVGAASDELGKNKPLVDSLSTTLGFVKGSGIAQALGAGIGVGESFSTGVAAGISDVSSVTKIKDAAAKIVTDAEKAARDAAKSSSPSRLFAEVGRDLSRGTAVGIGAGTGDVVAEAEAIVAAAFAAATQAAAGSPRIDPLATATIGTIDPSRIGVPSSVLAASVSQPSDVSQSIQVNLGGVRFDGTVTPEQAARVTKAATDAALASASDKAKALRVLAVAARAQGSR